MSEPIYLDFAATSAIRPPVVAEAVASFLGTIGATPGRGTHARAVEAGRLALRCRLTLARLLHIPGDPGRIAWMMNATHALNTALFGMLRPRDVLVTTVFDHNAVVRPAYRLSNDRGVHVRTIRGDRTGAIDFDDARRKLEGASLLVINGASNVLGTTLPIRELTEIAHDYGARVVVDAAQIAGHIDIDVDALGIDALAFTAHKALLGPQGLGGLWVRDGIRVDPLLTGGTGGDSLDPAMPDSYPDHLEAGTQNAPAIAGLLAALEWLEPRRAQLSTDAMRFKARLHDGLGSLEEIEVLSPPAPDGVPIVTMRSTRVDPSTLAARLDREHGVMTRAGLHCAPGVHRLLGTERTGALRFSIGWATTEQDIDAAVHAVAQVVA